MFEELSNFRKYLPTRKSFRNMTPIARREFKQGMAFLSPWIIGFFAFTFLPIIASLIFSFMNLSITDGILSTPKFVGFENYITLLKDRQAGVDPRTWITWLSGGTPSSMGVTISFALISLPIGILVPLGLAVLMNNPNLKGTMILRSLFYMPSIVPFVAAIFLWGGMLNSETGWINRVLIALGMPREATPDWANSTFWVYPTYTIMGIWGIGNAMLIMLAGLQGVPTELYDAATVDGANGWHTFWKITFPMISPVIFFNLVLSIVGLFQYFLVPLVVNNGTGRPGGATMFYSLYLFRNFFAFQDMSYGSTLAWFLFIIILLITYILFSTAKYWVYYAGDSRS